MRSAARVALLTVVVCGMLVGVVGCGSSRTVTTPELIGLSSSEAVRQAVAAGLRPSLKKVTSNLPPHIVFQQSPRPGARSGRGGEIVLIVSLGPRSTGLEI